jgi:guanine deaminase
LLTPGFIDAHIHAPQTAMIGAYGEQLLAWLENYTFPMERRFEEPEYARASAEFFLAELLRNGTTSAVVLGTVHPQSVDALGAVVESTGARMILGKVLMDRHAPPELCDSAGAGYDDSRELIERWHGRGRISYAITPRFAPTCSPEQLAAAARLHQEFPSTYVHTHLSESQSEVEWVKTLFPERSSYTDVYDHFGLVGSRSVFAHGIHLSDAELELLAESGSTIAFCPTSNLFLGSGLFPFERVREAGVSIALATDVGAGTSFSMLRTASEAYKVLQLQGFSLSVHCALYLASLGAARALELDEYIGNLEPGKEADFIVLDWNSTPLLALRSREARDFDDR